MQDPQMLDQLAKNITRCGLSNSTLNYLRVSTFLFDHVILFLISQSVHLNYSCSKLPRLLHIALVPLFIIHKAMCDIGAHARVDVQT